MVIFRLGGTEDITPNRPCCDSADVQELSKPLAGTIATIEIATLESKTITHRIDDSMIGKRQTSATVIIDSILVINAHGFDMDAYVSKKVSNDEPN